MYIGEKYSVISLGASCIVETNIQECFKSKKGWILDYCTSTIEATISIFEHYKNNTLFDALCNIDDYEIVISDNGEHIYKSNNITGFAVWHEQDVENMVQKIQHKIKNLSLLSDKKFFVFSNLQANLKWTMQIVGNSLDDVFLNNERYEKLCNLVKDIFDGESVFIVREELVNKDLLILDNVYTIEMQKIDGNGFGMWNLGPTQEFQKIFLSLE